MMLGGLGESHELAQTNEMCGRTLRETLRRTLSFISSILLPWFDHVGTMPEKCLKFHSSESEHQLKGKVTYVSLKEIIS